MFSIGARGKVNGSPNSVWIQLADIGIHDRAMAKKHKQIANLKLVQNKKNNEF